MPRLLRRPLLQLAVGLVAAIALTGCGDDSATKAPAAPSAPVATADLDDSEVVRLVFEAAYAGDAAALSELELPPRVSHARVAVIALHDHLLDRREPAVDRGQLLDALESLSNTTGGVHADAVPGLVAAWRKWTPAQWEHEKQLQVLMANATAALSLPTPPRSEGLNDILGRADALGPAPPMSVSAAGIEFVRLAVALLVDEGGDFTESMQTQLAATTAAFDALGWRGGFGDYLELIATHLMHQDLDSVRSAMVWNAAVESHRGGGDLWSAGWMYITRVQLHEGPRSAQDGDGQRMRSCERFVAVGRRLIEESGTTGKDLYLALTAHAVWLQRVGRHSEVVAASARALEIAEPAGVAAGSRGTLWYLRCVSLFRLGRYDEVIVDAATADPVYEEALAAAADPALVQTRASLAETVAEAALALGRADLAAERYQAAAALHAQSGSTQLRDRAQLQSARAMAKAGQRDEAVAVIDRVLEGDLPAALLASVVQALLDVEETGRASEVMATLESKISADQRVALAELRGMVASAKGDIVLARAEFDRALKSVGAASGPSGWPAARIEVAWADAEEAVGEIRRAVDHLGFATYHLQDGTMPGALDRLRERIVDLERERGFRHSAVGWARLRVDEGPPANSDAGRDARIDLALLVIEHYAFLEISDVALVHDLAAALPEADGEFLSASIPGATSRFHVSDPPAPDDPRLAMLHEAVTAAGAAELLDIARRARAFPSVRRLAARRGLGDPELTDGALALRLVEALRGADPDLDVEKLQLAQSAGGGLLLVEPCGQFCVYVLVTHDAVTVRCSGQGDGEGDGSDAIYMFRQAMNERDGTAVDNATRWLGETVSEELARVDEGALLTLSVAPPYGPLPWELCQVDGKQLLDRNPLTYVESATELLASRLLVGDEMPPTLMNPHDALNHRLALVETARIEPELFATMRRYMREELAADESTAFAVALQRAKQRLRDELEPPPDAVARWAAVTLRGAP